MTPATAQSPMLSWQPGGKRRVLALGGGFAGLAAIRALDGADCEILLIDRQNHHLFQPLLYQVASAGLSGSDIAQPLRSILAAQANVQVHRATITSINLAAKQVRVAETSETIDYDTLIIATGMVTNWFGKPQWSQHAIGLKNLHDAYRIRDRLLDAAEQAENTIDDEMVRHRLLTTVVVGSGPTGVEIAGAIAELSRREIETEFRVVKPHQLRVALVSADPRVLATFAPHLSEHAAKDLQFLGVELRQSASVRDLRPGEGPWTEVVLDGETIQAHTVIWAAGVHAPEFTRTMGVPLDRGGRFVVEADCSIPNYPDAFAVGDIAAMRHGNGLVPGVAQGAMQSGAFIGQLIRARLRGTTLRQSTFRYHDRGSMATIGRARAVAEIGSRCFSGRLAWALWLVIHVLSLIDLRSKLSVLLKWIAAYVFYRPSNRVVAARVAGDQ